MFSPVFLWVVFFSIYTTSAAKFEQIQFVEQVKCNAASNYSDESCNLCMQPSNASRKEGYDLRRNVEHGHIVFEDNGSNYLSWRYDFTVVHNPKNLTVSFNIWDSNLNMAYALPGCCGVSLSERRCRVSGCTKGLTYASISSKWGSVAMVYHLEAMKTCTTEDRPTVRFFHICVNATREWKKRYNCECAVYDSFTGLLKPGNQSSEIDKNKSDAGLWTTSYQVCIFSMKKDDVMKRGHLQDNAEAMDSVAFGRGVFYMRGFTGYNGTVFDTVLRQTVNCTLKTFEGDDMFNISSLDVAQYHQPHNNDSFTCLAPWPNGTQQFQTNGTHVKCMPKNTTHQHHKSEVYMKNMRASTGFDSAMSVFIPVLGAVAVVVVICFTAFVLRKKYNKFMKEMKHVPEELDTVMKESFYDYVTRIQSFTDDEKEDCQAFDKEEKDRIFLLRHKEKNKCRDRSQLENHVFVESLNNQHCECYSEQVTGHGDVIDNPSMKFSKIPMNTQFVENRSMASKGCVDCRGCLKASGSSRSRRQENDSGCPPSVTSGHGLDSDDDTPSTSSEVSYCVRHVCSNETPQNDVFSPNLPEKIGEINPNHSVGYWSKSDEVKSPDSVSHLSIDTGCGTDCDEYPSCFEYREKKTDLPFAKASFKDCKVTQDNCFFNSTKNSSPQMIVNMHEFGYLDKSLRVCSNQLNRINFSSVEAT